ncbi:MAG: ubiquinol-cytochrome c reductase iron-sulfur subunit [Planctomycetaceae bacterium]
MADHSPKPTPTGDGLRRNFLTSALAVIVGSVVGLVPFASAMAMLFDPLIKRREGVLGKDENGFLEITSVSSLASDGTPRLFKVVADLQDAWNKFPQTEIGSVYLRQTANGVACLAARCPHLGCTVDYKPDLQAFVCPCHDSSFDLDGKRNNDIPPRDMDTLSAEVRGGEIRVKFQKFRAGIHEQKEA